MVAERPGHLVSASRRRCLRNDPGELSRSLVCFRAAPRYTSSQGHGTGAGRQTAALARHPARHL